MKEIDGDARTIRELLSGRKYTVDYYQREYRWQTKHVRELLEDLSTSFLDSYDPEHDRKKVQSYGYYFLGSIVLSRKKEEGQDYIVDGQQRLTTLTLLLIYLHHRQGERADRVRIEDLIFSERYGQRSFNVDVPERTPLMENLFAGKPYDVNDVSESVRNIAARYQDIEQLFPEDIDETALPFFVDWLIDNVYLVEISAVTDDDAYTIFETMNDRGLSLTPLDMLRGFLLARITDERQRLAAASVWKRRLSDLADFGKDEDADAVKAWLRSQYAQTTRERRRGAEAADFERLGTEFHRWVRENQNGMGLEQSPRFVEFINHDLDFYARHYLRLRRASSALTTGLETVFYNAQREFNLQYPLLLAPLLPSDDEGTIARKTRVVAAFVDILITRRAVNYLTLTYGAMCFAVFHVMKRIRRLPLDQLVSTLRAELDSLGCDFTGTADKERRGMADFGLNQWSRRYIRHILARLTHHLERQSGMPSHFADYLVSSGRNCYEIEHIWADHPERHETEFPNGQGFAEYRNRIGGLLLLPKTFNAAYGDLPYEAKLEHYSGQNLLARSLHPRCYKLNPGFQQYIQRSGLPFHAHTEFKKKDLDERQELYRLLAEEIWSPSRLEREATS